MLMLGFQKEVENLFFRKDIHKNLPSIRCIGYRQIWEYLEYQINYETMLKKIIFATRKLAKHQMTWLKKWKNLNFLNASTPNFLFMHMLDILKEKYKLNILL